MKTDDYREKFYELIGVLLILIVVILIGGFYTAAKIGEMIRNANEKDEIIWQLETEKVELKEQIHILKYKEV